MKTMLMICRIDCGIELLMKNLLDQSEIGHGKDKTKGNASEAKIKETKSGLKLEIKLQMLKSNAWL